MIEKKSGKKDACYSKVKSRYSVWPSAYASGALVKCRKKGAKLTGVTRARRMSLSSTLMLPWPTRLLKEERHHAQEVLCQEW